MLRTLLAITLYAIPMISYAISCPSNGKIISIGDTIAQVVEMCGDPNSTRQHTENTVVSAKWTYYKKVSGSDNSKVTILFNNMRVTNINVASNSKNCRGNEGVCPPVNQDLTSTNLCSRIIQTGNNMQYVQSACGAPAEEKVLQSDTKEISELSYTSDVGPSVLVFENGLLTDWSH